MNAKFQACYLPILAEFAAVDDVRYYINGFYIEPAPASVGGVYLIATDGHSIVVIHDPKGESDGDYILPVPRRLLGTVGKQKTKTTDAVGAVQMVLLDGRMAMMTMGEAFSEHDIAVSCKPIDGKFPDVRRVISYDWSNLDQSEAITANAFYLARLKRIGKSLDADGMPIQIRRCGGALLCIPELRDHSVFAVIMMMKLDTRDEPEWLTTFRTMQDGDGWSQMTSAPKKATLITVKMADGTVHERAHWACGGGDDGPSFEGWFIEGPGCFREINTPVAWKPLAPAVVEKEVGHE